MSSFSLIRSASYNSSGANTKLLSISSNGTKKIYQSRSLTSSFSETSKILHRNGNATSKLFRGVQNIHSIDQGAFRLVTIEDLYEEILFIIFNHMKWKTNDVDFKDILEFVKDVFNISNTKHHEILESAMRKEPPKLRLNVEIIKAEKLVPKDANGFSDPFVTLYLESNGSHRYNSSVKHTTLNPVWEEHFSL